ncbi:MAG: GNAT family N-acetyltransferase [Chloroflexi bacterium]|nr:GNAT family N-acetyltransferase [Chloroflexota bacterium]
MTRIFRLPRWSPRQHEGSQNESSQRGANGESGCTRGCTGASGPGPIRAIGSSRPVPSQRPEIARGRLTSFRRFRAEDAQDLLRWGRHDDPLLDSYNMGLRTPAEASRWFEAREAWADAQLYAVDSLEEGRVIGYIGLREIDMARRCSVLGISFDPGIVGHGYGTDSLRCFLKHYFENWKYAAMFLDVAAPNRRAQRCYDRCGFLYTGERWKPFVGPSWKALKSPLVKDHPEMFQLSGNSLNMLYYDMYITLEQWRQHQAETAPSL